MKHIRITRENIKDFVSFRLATPDDVPELIPVYQRFYAEAVYKDFLEFDPVRARETILNGITYDVRPHVLALIDDTIVGFIALIIDHSFSVKPCAVMMELYVVPEWRRGAIGRYLVGFAVMLAKDRGAGAFHAPVASGMTEARSLFNLFDKAGFKQFGFMLRRGL
jgi:GNAT superfamily N-acetyltransferase